MKKGVIVVFDKNDFDLLEKLPSKSFFNKQTKICFVNNGNDNKILKFLFKLKESSKFDISILNLRKEKTSMAAVKVGVRFLSRTEDINLIVHTPPINIFNKNLMKKMLKISDQDFISKIEKRVMLRKVYALNELINC
jgi:hypothetical protein